jgi:hypothetical protein
MLRRSSLAVRRPVGAGIEKVRADEFRVEGGSTVGDARCAAASRNHFTVNSIRPKRAIAAHGYDATAPGEWASHSRQGQLARDLNDGILQRLDHYVGFSD